MSDFVARNKAFLVELFEQRAERDGIWLACPQAKPPEGLGDFTLSEKPVEEWVKWMAGNYEVQRKFHEGCGDDSVPFLNLNTNTGIFAAAFGCEIHVYEGQDTNAAARPLVGCAEEAAKLGEASINSKELTRVLDFARALRKEVGKEVPISVPDIQSPFDVAALVWNKEDFFMAMLETPEVVKELVGKCERLLVEFLDTFRREVGNVNMCHCPRAWAPEGMGVWLSEDEVGALSPAAFEEFCLPTLTRLSERYGGMFMHCCAKADHQYGGFLKVPKLRALNRVFQEVGPVPAFRAFGKRPFMVAWMSLEGFEGMLKKALPETRFLLNPDAGSVEEGKRVMERLWKVRGHLHRDERVFEIGPRRHPTG